MKRSYETLQEGPLKYYTQSPIEEGDLSRNFIEELLRANLTEGNNHFRNLVDKCLAPFATNIPDSTGKVIDTRIQAFTDGTPTSPLTSKEHKERFEQEVQRVVAYSTYDLFNRSGGLRSDINPTTWNRIQDITPKLIAILTSRKNYITHVQEAQALNIIGTALHCSRYNIQPTIRVGFGGSDDEFTTERLAAYTIPALRIAEQMQEVYTHTYSSELRQASIAKERKKVKAETGQDLTKDQKRYLADNPTSNLSEEEIGNIRSTIPITPNVQFFFAYNAATVINSSMIEEGIKKRANENIQALQEHVDTYYPHLSPSVEFMTDTPWELHTPEQKLTLEYLAHLLRESKDETIEDTLQFLQKRGSRRGGDDGAELAAEYAALHPLIFGDRINLPFASSFLTGDNAPPEITITIGNKTERHFCAIRHYLETHATPEGFVKFLETEKTKQSTPIDLEVITNIIKKTKEWVITKEADLYTSDDNLPLGNTYPLHVVALITNLCNTPAYYVTEFDQPRGQTDLSTAIANLHELSFDTTTTEGHNKKTIRNLVVYDLSALHTDITRRRSIYQ